MARLGRDIHRASETFGGVRLSTTTIYLRAVAGVNYRDARNRSPRVTGRVITQINADGQDLSPWLSSSQSGKFEQLPTRKGIEEFNRRANRGRREEAPLYIEP